MQTKEIIKPAINPQIVLAVAVTAISFSAILVRMSTAIPSVMAFYRLLFTCILLAPLAYKDRAELQGLRRNDLYLCGLGGVFLAFHFVFWFASLSWTSVSSAALLVNIHPLVVVTAGWLFFNEKFRPMALPGAAIAILGMAVLGWGDLQLEGDALIGDLYAAAGGLMVAGYFLVGRHVRARLGIANYSLLVYGTSAVLLLGYNFIMAHPLTGYASTDWLTFFALAVIPTIFGHTFLNWSLKYLPAGAISVSVLGEPVIATLLAIPFLKEVPGTLQIFGGLLVIWGIWHFLRNR